MLIHAYPEIYLNKAQSKVGEAFDYAINACKISGDDFSNMFCVSHIGRSLENGEPQYLLGKSGIELAIDVIEGTTGKAPSAKPIEGFGRSVEYWIGWAVSYYQWHSGRRYINIFEAVPYNELARMYHPLHEADVTKFADIMDSRLKAAFPDTNIRRLRRLCGLTQEELANRSCVSLRSIQMYEQRNKDINKASAETLYNIARVFGCQMENLLER